MSVAAPPRPLGWAGLFHAAFTQSRNSMVLVDDRRRQVEVNGAYLMLLGYRRDDVLGRPLYDMVAGRQAFSPGEWEMLLTERRFSGEVGLLSADGTVVGVQFGATPEVVTGRRLVLFVAAATSKWGRHFRRDVETEAE